MTRVKLTKNRDRPIDPAVASMVSTLIKGHRDEIIAQEERIRRLEAQIHGQEIMINNHEVLFADLHSCFAALGSTVRHSSTKKAVEELAELAERSLTDYKTQPLFQDVDTY